MTADSTAVQAAPASDVTAGTPRRGILARGGPFALFAAYAIAMLLLIASSLIDFGTSRDLDERAARVSRTLEAIERLRLVVNTVSVGQASARGYLLTGDERYLPSYRDARQSFVARLPELESLLADDPAQRASLDRLRAVGTRRFDQADALLEAYRDRGQAAATAMLATDGAQEIGTVRNAAEPIIAEENRVLAQQHSAVERSYSNGLAKSLGADAIVALALTAVYLMMHRYLRQRDAALRTIEATNAALEQRVVDRTTDLSDLSRHLLDVREQEKKIIARDLHDDFGSYLTAINMDVSRVRDKISPTSPELAAKLDRTLTLLNSAIEMKRQLISELRPSMLDNLGLGPALEQYIEEWSRRTRIRASFDHEGDLTSSEEGCTIAIFRVFQEALNNVAKHAHANRVAGYAYRTDDRIEFEIADDGRGITADDRAKTGGHGLLGIRERILAYDGRLEILNGASGGTIVRGSMPCRMDAARRARPSTMQIA